jgi:hypothetical protein
VLKLGWSAYHLYYHSSLDWALEHLLRPLVVELWRDRLIDRFFFVRYTLGGPHLRMRFEPAESVGRAERDIADRLTLHAREFLTRWPSSTTLDPEKIQAESCAILAASPEESDLYYENNSMLPFPYLAEYDRYGGEQHFEPTLDFFTLSSLEALEAISLANWALSGRRGARVMRLLLRQACGFSRDLGELTSHLGYRLPLGTELADAVWSKADRDFEARGEAYRLLVQGELELLMDGARGRDLRLFYGARRLSKEVPGLSPEARWRLGHSHVHMTANRLGFPPPQEMHLQRILWRAMWDLEATDRTTWQRVSDWLPSADGGEDTLAELSKRALNDLCSSDAGS